MINGVLNIYKEKGYTSHDIVAKLRKLTGQKKIGHTGTLDPDAEGVLVVCLGKATKLCDMLADQEKTYETVLLLGKETDTQDISGRVLSEKETGRIRVEAVENCIRGYIGIYSQLSPMYSARKVNGKKLYEFAREGREVERPEKKVTIYDIDIIEICIPRVLMRVRCSKGTYIRTLCHDIGQSLGTGGCMERLLRKKVGCFDKENSVTLKELEQCVWRGELSRFLIPLDEMFLHLKKIVLNEKLQQRAYNGNDFLRRELPGGLEFKEREEVRVYDQAGRFIGIYQYNELQRSFQVRKMFLDEEELRG